MKLLWQRHRLQGEEGGAAGGGDGASGGEGAAGGGAAGGAASAFAGGGAGGDPNGAAAGSAFGGGDGAGAAGGGAPAGGEVPEWASTWADTELKTWAAGQEKIDGIEGLARAHKGLLELRGVPAEGLLKLAPFEDREAWHGPGGVFEKLGRPETAVGYNLPEFEAEDGKIDLVGPFREEIFSLGVSKETGEQLGAKMLGIIETGEQQIAAAKEQQALNEIEAMKLNWGEAYAPNMAVSQAGARALGFDTSTEEGIKVMDGFMKTVGTQNFITRMFEIGQMIGDAGSGDHGQGQGTGAGMSAAEAQSEITRMNADAGVKAILTNPQHEQFTETHKKMDQLYQWANPPGSEPTI